MDIVDGLRLVAGAPTQSIGCLNCHSRMHEAADEIERLRAELDRTRKAAFRGMDAAKAASSAQLEVAKRLLAESNPDALESERGANASLTDEIERLRAELAECRRDAERYRWIRGNVPSHSTRWSRWKVEYFYGASGWNDLRHAKLDAEIDAALAAKGEKNDV